MATLYLILYQLKRPQQEYQQLYAAIRNLGPSRHLSSSLTSAWMVLHAGSADTIRDILMAYVDENDRIFVAEVTVNSSGWLDNDDIAWITQARVLSTDGDSRPRLRPAIGAVRPNSYFRRP